MVTLPLDILSKEAKAAFVAERDEFVELLVSWVVQKTGDDILKKHAKQFQKGVVAIGLVNAEWAYNDKGDVVFKANFAARVMNILDPEYCTRTAKARWQEAQALMPEVVYGAKYSEFIKKYESELDTTALDNGGFAALMRSRRKASR